MKTAIARYLKRSNTADPDFVEIKDSASVVKFCQMHLSKPESKAGLDERLFYDIKPEIFLQRNADAMMNITTLAGISKKYQYVCEVIFLSIFWFYCKTYSSEGGGYSEMEKVSLFLPSVSCHGVEQLHCQENGWGNES